MITGSIIKQIFNCPSDKRKIDFSFTLETIHKASVSYLEFTKEHLTNIRFKNWLWEDSGGTKVNFVSIEDTRS